MLALALLLTALVASIPLATRGCWRSAVRQSSRGPPQWAETVRQTPAQRREKAEGPARQAAI